VHSDATHLVDNYDWWDKVIGFEMVSGPEPRFIGSTWLPVRLHVERSRTTGPGRTRALP
jgi:hypothetical protein